jgi:prevent-host-death family protein
LIKSKFWPILDINISPNKKEGTNMKPLSISQNIVSLSDFKNKASKMLHEIQSSRRPLVITQNGKAAAVLISPPDFDLLTERARFIDAVQRGLTDVQNGRVLPDEDLDKEL